MKQNNAATTQHKQQHKESRSELRRYVLSSLSLVLSFSLAVRTHSSIVIALSFCPPSLSLSPHTVADCCFISFLIITHPWSFMFLIRCSSLSLAVYLSVCLSPSLAHSLTCSLTFCCLVLSVVILLIVVRFCFSLQVIGFMSHFLVALCQNKSRIARSMNRCEYVLNKFVGNLI